MRAAAGLAHSAGKASAVLSTAINPPRSRLTTSVLRICTPRSSCTSRRCLHSSVAFRQAASSPPAPSSAASSSPPPSALMQDDARYIVGTYARQAVEFVSGSGCELVDASGRVYIDFYSGIAVNALGHSHPAWVKAVQQQAEKLCHVSNLFYSQPQVQLAKTLVTHSSFDKVFFCNSGTEANEAALKFARKFAYERRQGSAAASTSSSPSSADSQHEFVSFNGGFHGRTMGALSVTYKKAYKLPFAPLLDGCVSVDYNDTQAAMQAITQRTCAVIVEPVQGEGGVNIGQPAFLAALRRRCDEVNALLILDEVQVGLGRTGRLFCHQHFPGLQPDILTLAKPLAGGLPIGAVLVTDKVAQVMKPGDHGTTFAGGPLVTAAAQATLDVIRDERFLQQVRQRGRHLVNRLRQLRQTLDAANKQDGVRVVEIRSVGYDFSRDSGEGQGLLVGLELNAPVKRILALAAERGVLLISAGDRVLRLVPPLIISEQQIDAVMDVLSEICSSSTVAELSAP